MTTLNEEFGRVVQEKDVRLVREAVSGSVSGDARQFRRVFYNLIDNVVKSTWGHSRTGKRSWPASATRASESPPFTCHKCWTGSSESIHPERVRTPVRAWVLRSAYRS